MFCNIFQKLFNVFQNFSVQLLCVRNFDMFFFVVQINDVMLFEKNRLLSISFKPKNASRNAFNRLSYESLRFNESSSKSERSEISSCFQ